MDPFVHNFVTVSLFTNAYSAGTGLLTYYIYQKYSNAEYIAADYTRYSYKKKYDAVVSALSIHHLTDDDKQAV